MPSLYWWHQVCENSDFLHSKTKKNPKKQHSKSDNANAQVSNESVKGGWERESLNGPVAGQLVCVYCV